jgi:hypothetical protein
MQVHLLADEGLVSEIRQLVSTHTSSCPAGEAGRVWGELKTSIARTAQDWQRRRNLERRHHLADKVKQAANARAALVVLAGMGLEPGSGVVREWKEARVALTRVYEDAARRVFSSTGTGSLVW